MSYMVELIITIACTGLASSGLWSFLQYRVQTKTEKKDASHDALAALLRHDMRDIYETWKNADEVPESVQEEMDSLYQPYHALGYNHLGEKMHTEIMAKKTKTNQ